MTSYTSNTCSHSVIYIAIHELVYSFTGASYNKANEFEDPPDIFIISTKIVCRRLLPSKIEFEYL